MNNHGICICCRRIGPPDHCTECGASMFHNEGCPKAEDDFERFKATVPVWITDAFKKRAKKRRKP